MSDPCPLASADFKFLPSHDKINLLAQWFTRAGYKVDISTKTDLFYVFDEQAIVARYAYALRGGENYCLQTFFDFAPFDFMKSAFMIDPHLHWSMVRVGNTRCGICRDTFYTEVSYWCPVCYNVRLQARSSGICWLNCVRGALCRDVVGHVVKMLCCVVTYSAS